MLLENEELHYLINDIENVLQKYLIDLRNREHPNSEFDAEGFRLPHFGRMIRALKSRSVVDDEVMVCMIHIESFAHELMSEQFPEPLFVRLQAILFPNIPRKG
jgi:hypothetical protein